MTTAGTIVLASTPNPVPPGDAIATTISVTLGDQAGALLAVDDDVTLNLTLPTGITVAPNPDGITPTSFVVGQAGTQPFNLRFAVAASVAPGTKSIAFTWTNSSQKQAAVAGIALNLVVGFSKTATLVYTAAPVSPVSTSQLVTALTAVALDTASIESKAGVKKKSDATAASGSNAQRTIVFSLPYPVRAQFNGGDALPKNTTTRQFFVVTTTGGTASIGQLVYDNGSGEGTTVLEAASTNLVIETAGTTDFTGGAISLTKGHEYAWSGAAWVDQGASSIASHAFQQSFPMSAGAQAKAFVNLYEATIGAYLGSVVTSTVAIGT